MSAILLPNGKQYFETSAGIPLVGGKVYTYAAGSSTPQTTWQDSGQVATNTNPVILDARGEASIFWNGSYKVTLKDALDNLIWTQDNIVATLPDTTLRANLLASTGSSIVGFIQSGAGAVATTVQAALWHHAIHLSDYYNGTLATGVDITTALAAAIVAASARVTAIGGVAKVFIPAAYYFMLSATITVPTGVIVEGAGKLETYLRRIGNYGHTFVVGTANPANNVQCAGIRNLCMFQDHGGGTVPSTNPASWINPTTGSYAHIIAYTPVACDFSNLNLYCMPFQMIIEGGSLSVLDNIDTYGVWDDGNAVMQETLAGLFIDMDTSVTNSIPTWHTIRNCRFGGMTRPGASVTYYGAHVITTTKNIGPANCVTIECAESLVFDNCYTGAGNSNGFLFSSQSTQIMAGIMISNHFFDPCGVKYQDACVKFENRDLGAIINGVTITGSIFKGQLNGWRAISDWGNTATLGSVTNLRIDGVASEYIGNPVDLYNVRRAELNMTISSYNMQNWYSADQACAVHIAAGCVGVRISGMLGGGVYGETAAGANNRCVDGVRADSYLNSFVTVDAVNMGLSGSIFVGPPANVAISTLTTDFTLTVGGSSPNIVHTGVLVGAINCTLSATNAVDGSTFRISRTGAGAFNLNVVGATTKALATGNWVEFRYLVGTGWTETAFGAL